MSGESTVRVRVGTTRRPVGPGAPPTVRQIYALAAALCERMGEEFPETQAAASATIERLRIENGHPQPRLEDTPYVPVWRRFRG
jgi:hypothetical protein